MKTLKILIVVLIGTLITAYFMGMFEYEEHTQLYAEQPVPKKKENDKSETSQLSENGYNVGDAATDFNLLNIDDTVVSLKDYNNAKGFIIIFTCNHCPYSVAYEDRIIDLDKKYKNLGYPVIAINPNNPSEYPTDGFEEMKTRAKEKGFTFPYLFDDGQKIYPQYGATKTPHVFLLQKEGDENIVKYIGAIDDNYQDAKKVNKHYLSDAVQALLEGRPVEVTKTVAIGCRIK